MAEVLAPCPSTSVAIIGGGLAGLSAAAKLSEQGIQVTLFEASPQLGGRARRVVLNNTALDNGQHILLGAYHQTLKLLQLIDVDERSALQRLPLSLCIQKTLDLHAWSFLPAPLHLLFGLCTAKGLNWPERLAAIHFFIQLKLKRFKLAKDLSLADFLSQHQQPQKLVQSLWEPLCLAALNTPLHIASAQVFVNVLRDSFNHKKSDSDLLLPKIDLSTLLADPIATYIQNKGGKVLVSQAIKQIEQDKEGFKLSNSAGDQFWFSHVIIATSPSQTNAFGLKVNLPTFTYQPIYTVYIQYPEDTKLPRIMTGLCNTISQWVFDRGQLCGQAGLISVVISAEGAHQKLTQEQLAEKVIQELVLTFPELPSPIWHKVIAEKRATFACKANLKRPKMQTSLPNLYLAGDYLESDYPATIESAIRSGVACATEIARRTHAKS